MRPETEAEIQKKLLDSSKKPMSVARKKKRGWIVSKSVVNFWLDFFLLLCFVALCCTQVLLQTIFPEAEAAKGWLLWGMTFTDYQSIQFGIFVVFALSVVIHITLHWPWVCGIVVNKFRKHKWGGKHQLEDGIRTLWGVGTLIIFCNIIGGVLALAKLMIQGPE